MGQTMNGYDYDKAVATRRDRIRSGRYKTDASGMIGAFILVVLFGVTVGTWLTMLGLGVLHSVVPAVPALSLFDSFWVLVGLTLIWLPHTISSTVVER